MTKLRSCVAVAVLVAMVAGVGAGLYARRQAAEQIALIDRVLLSGGQLPDWEPRLQRALWWYPKNDQAWLQYGFLLQRDERFADAAVALGHVADSSEFHQEATFSRAKSLLSDGQYELGEVVLRDHVAKYPRSIDAWDLYYLLLQEQFRQDELIESLRQRVLELRTSFQFLPLHLKAVASSSVAQKVESRLLAVHEKHPDQPCVLAALARAAWLKGERERAKELFLHLLPQSELRPRFVLWAAEFFLDTQDSPQARAFLQKIESPSELQLSDAPVYWFVEARASALEANYDQALEQIDQALKLKPAGAKFHTLRATVLRRLKREPEAIGSNEAAARYGAADEELYRQSTTIGQTPPAPDVCHRIAEMMRIVGHEEVADAWLDLEQTLRTGRPDRSEPDGR